MTDTPHNTHGYPILVHSHLRWDWVWQRPQQFLSRLSARHPVLFVEEPVPAARGAKPRPRLRNVRGLPNLAILQPELPTHLRKRASIDDALFNLVAEVLASPFGRGFRRPVQWFYNPMSVMPFAGRFDARAVVYDCMDQLSQFRGAPPELVQRERMLLTLADVVFAGGPKIHEAKSAMNSNCHCFGCGVDVAHFGKARLETTPILEEIAALPGPRVGYFGVIDERLDYDLLAGLADTHPEWSVVMIGPWTKIDPVLLPQRANLHWLGARDYDQLPSAVKGLDVCLMPFALNEATEFINPTKALEYMATGRPIVSTAVEDVARQFSNVVYVANSCESFVAACERVLLSRDVDRLHGGLDLARRNSWESIVAKLETHIGAVLERRANAEVCAA
jgi:glycosyltransferase involved in cell wall biosynthesis